ncbi:MAG: HD domain-containing protein [Anaerolineales bacterium]
MFLSEKYETALSYAFHAHQQQKRKATEIPYFAHLISVSALVLENGGSEDEAIAGLLHDAAEDQGGEERLHDIRVNFGDAVADIVAGCSDTFSFPKPPWRQRKQAYLSHLVEADPSTQLVSLADKLHNLRDILSSYRREGEITWQRFKAGKAGTLWYYQQLVEIFSMTGPKAMALELQLVYDELLDEIGAAEEYNSSS